MEDFTIFYMDRISRKENQGRSFTRGACFRDFMKENQFNTELLRDEIQCLKETVWYKLAIHTDVVDQFSVRTLLELLWNDELDEICSYFYFAYEDQNEDNTSETWKR